MHAPGRAAEVTVVGNSRVLPLLVDSEAALRKDYLSASKSEGISRPDRRASPSLPVRSSEAVLVDSGTFLELLVVLGAWSEAAAELDLPTVGSVTANAARHLALLDAICPYDPEQVVQEYFQSFPRLTVAEVDVDTPTLAVSAMVQLCLGNLATCPIADLERRANELGSPDLGHRCRKAYDALVAFTRRNRLEHDDAGRVLGRAYADARLSVEEVAAGLGISVPDALVFLDRHGYARGLKRVALGDAERDAAYAAMRRDRLVRRGASPAAARELAAINVVASQRIEDIDARRWIPNADRS